MGLRNMQAMNDAGMQNDGYELSDWILLEWIARRTKDGKTGIKYFTWEFMLSDLPLSESTLKRSLTRLEERGTISVERLKRYRPSYNLAITHTGYLYALENKPESKQSVVTLTTRSAELSPFSGNGHADHSNGHADHSQNGNGHADHSQNGNGHADHSPETHKEVDQKEVKSVKEIERLAAASIGFSQSENSNSDSTSKPGAPTATPDGVIRGSGEDVQSMKLAASDAVAPVSRERDVLPDSPGKRASSGDQSVANRPRRITGFIQEDRADRLRRTRQLRRI